MKALRLVRYRMIRCRICQNDRKNKSIFAKELTLGVRKTFEYIVCSKCQSLSIGKVPQNLDQYYNEYPNFEEVDKNLNFFKRMLYKKAILKKNRFAKYILNFDQSRCVA